jgi:hypothetical protein
LAFSRYCDLICNIVVLVMCLFVFLMFFVRIAVVILFFWAVKLFSIIGVKVTKRIVCSKLDLIFLKPSDQLLLRALRGHSSNLITKRSDLAVGEQVGQLLDIKIRYADQPNQTPINKRLHLSP